MFQYYLKIAIRSLLRRKAFTVINVMGLAIGMAVCLVIGKYIQFETGYDNFHENAANTYRINSSFYTDHDVDPYGGYDLGPSLFEYFPGIASFVRCHANGSMVVYDNGEKQVKHQESKMLFVDSTFFGIFSFNVIRGVRTKILADPYSIVITESVARKYFGRDIDPIGKELRLADGWVPGIYTVSGVIRDVPPNSHFEFEFLIPMHNLLKTDFYRNNHSRWDNFKTYVLIRNEDQLREMETRNSKFMVKYRGADKAINPVSRLLFQNVLAIHYSPDLENEGSRRRTVYFLGLIAVFVLMIAWINYINLSTARAVERAKEVGVKKAIGVMRTQLIAQFFFESALINLISFIISLGLAFSLLPLLNNITGRSFAFNTSDLSLTPAVFGLFVAGSFASGLYPAFILSSYRAVDVIKGKSNKTSSGFALRNGLVAIQFSCSLLLLVMTFVVYRQVRFMQSQEKGFETNSVVVIKGPEVSEQKNLPGRVAAFKNQLQQFSFVDKVCTSFSVPGEGASLSTGIRKSDMPLEQNRIGNVYWIDPNFMSLYSIPVIAGKAWNPMIATDMKSVIINEEAVKVFQLGTNESALTSRLIVADDTLNIAAVMKNHHWSSFKDPLAPMIFRAETVSTRSISVRMKGNSFQGIEIIKKKFEAAFPDELFSCYFLDDAFDSKYRDEQEFGLLFSSFSAIAILLGCLGLWGLASFTTIYRMKEVSIRKVLGASGSSIVYLLASQFLKPLVIAMVVILPLVWLGVEKWLAGFPYRISMTPDLFLWPILVLLFISFASVSLQTIKAALVNPANALKNE